ncbi:asparagine synthetase domain-containing protein 1 [Daktulosphaira vitifoliae]|uniref:asparagine synthetase domain-containing protein 1 n=1 Tax=Daktulosphaira vitifoliae TaxID=58002 RepID=UPI0021AA8F35|nr:asparagine synthetase domain-containing protein 1 [Daktulosphaira vitifoliae]
MCGIFCSVSKGSKACSEYNNCRPALQKRGPDINSLHETIINGYITQFSGNTLWIQGEFPTKQPFIDVNGNILLWNGDVYKWKLPMNTCIKDSDTKIISDFLSNGGNFELLISSIQGPYSIIYYDNSQKILWAGRDPIGRISLLWNLEKEKIIITSVGCKDVENLEEVPAIGLFKFDLKSNNLKPQLLKWTHSTLECEFSITNELEYFKPVNSQKTILENSILYKTTHLNMSDLLLDPGYNLNVSKLIHFLSQSIEKRSTIIPKACKLCNFKCDHAKVAILFSGGIDSTVLAFLASKYVEPDEPIDLLNVSFEKLSDLNNYNGPDRQTCYDTLEELKILCPKRCWNLVEINVPFNDLKQKRLDVIRHLIYPLKTVLDDSLGCSLWFASQGIGICNGKSYKTPARVLLSGMGADELLGGYTRYRRILQRQGWEKLGEEFNNDFFKLPSRNLGRDNRVCCDHGRQLRLPFLDEDLVEFVRDLMPWERCWPKEPYSNSFGEKLLLRLAAYKIGLIKTAFLTKRAMQFGSRIANKKENGNDLSDRL